MKKKYAILALTTILILTSIFLTDRFFFRNSELKFRYPYKNTLFPKEFAPPSFYIDDHLSASKIWIIEFSLKNNELIYTDTINKSPWEPSSDKWNSIKEKSGNQEVTATLKRENSNKRNFLTTRAVINFSISEDSVGAPILYREIPLPFSFAEQNSQFMNYSVCNVGDPKGSYRVLSGFKVCGNCHSFTADGKKIALDFDASHRDKGGYFIADIDSQIVFSKENYLSWSKLLGKSTFGMLSKISNDGNYVVTTIKDRAISEKFNSPDKLAYSQLFFPVNGVLAVYNTQTKSFDELPGANDLNYVQTNAIWTPDNKHIIFAKAKAIPYEKGRHGWDKIPHETVKEFIEGKRSFKYDLYIIPYNDGKGGEARPIMGASNNGKSNYFPAISPDGKWLVYCQSNNFMMLQPDSKLFITNLETGDYHELKSNLPSMNSWHAWSPNGKWLVFTSKLSGPYTDLYLTHISENGEASTPILINKARRNKLALNYPEFVNLPPDRPINMVYDYVNLVHIEDEINMGNMEKAKDLFDEYLAQAQFGTPSELQKIAEFFKIFGNKKEAEEFLEKEKALFSEFHEEVKN